MTLHFYWTYLKTQKGPNYWYEKSYFVWCLLSQQNGGLNSGQKSANIVTDAFSLLHSLKMTAKLFYHLFYWCLMSQSKIFHSYMKWDIDVHAIEGGFRRFDHRHVDTVMKLIAFINNFISNTYSPVKVKSNSYMYTLLLLLSHTYLAFMECMLW